MNYKNKVSSSNNNYTVNNKNIIIKLKYIKEKQKNTNKKVYRKMIFLINMKKNLKIKIVK